MMWHTNPEYHEGRTLVSLQEKCPECHGILATKRGYRGLHCGKCGIRWLELDAGRGCAFLYVVQDTARGDIKIGRSVSPLANLMQLQRGNPRPLELRALLRVRENGCSAEAELHRKLDKFRHAGEWFHPEIVETVLTIFRVHKKHEPVDERLLRAIVIDGPSWWRTVTELDSMATWRGEWGRKQAADAIRNQPNKYHRVCDLCGTPAISRHNWIAEKIGWRHFEIDDETNDLCPPCAHKQQRIINQEKERQKWRDFLAEKYG